MKIPLIPDNLIRWLGELEYCLADACRHLSPRWQAIQGNSCRWSDPNADRWWQQYLEEKRHGQMLLAEIGDHRLLGWAVSHQAIKRKRTTFPSCAMTPHDREWGCIDWEVMPLVSIGGRQWGKVLMKGKPLHGLSSEERLAAIASLEICTLRMYQGLKIWSQLSQQHRLARIFTLIIQDEHKHHLSAWQELISIMGIIKALALFSQWETRKLHALCSFVWWR